MVDREEDDDEVLLTNTTDCISKYDILVFEKDNELDFVSSDQVLPPHIGNNRLKVFCKMNTQNFIKATTEEEQTEVIRTILHIVEQQCANDEACTSKGKFWKAGMADTWAELPRSEAMEFIKGLLENEQEEQAAIMPTATAVPEEEKKRRRRSSLLRRSLSSGNMIEDQKKRVAYRRSVLMQLETLDVSDDDSDDDDDEDEDRIIRRIPIIPPTEAKKPPPPHLSSNQADENEDGDDNSMGVKSESQEDGLDQDTISTAPKTNLRRTIARSPSLTSLTTLGANTIVTAEALDVILLRHNDDSPYELVANHTGNNRLLVMIHQRTRKYQEISHHKLEVHRLCLELVETIRTFYNGRFLVEQSNSNFLKLSPEQAAAALVAVFATEVRTVAPPPVATKQSAMEAIAALSAGTAVASEAHKTALESLKQKKKRQDTQNKITLNYARFGGPADKPPPTVVMPHHHLQSNHQFDSMQHSTRPSLDQRALSVGALQQQQQQLEPQQFRRASVGIMPSRRSTLSAFSAGMIEDMLHRLDAEAQELERQSFR